ncbi:thiol reductant ABC exporter subunit CydD [Weissella cibaria]|jgi:thiol reductant ABC exporter, CydD subunit|uniref:Thiol reductant ABC exporter subunit CydD n=1 Tax=Weissella cibaria TaxID=137591 RepID=A0A1X4JKR7_9LACO|nr:thiol reductant ABC exporter subunit CydD [Weissella cibaria]MBZ5942751.1 thiol reductant ABC exporter subunit CydD [Weissella cibaria]MCB5826385.1 thiol reductant ABC exporter subunit CydD [Weissella cibaria]MCB5857944.1 thiol reductant ABC exporter subunit CydD [Weissella cibaria]MCB5860170.1 thiol reductant ABC exporter subunit CydD [Weissella cibaria]MCB5862838.1 thiol reductant ABC exporter subunit CydD [Weissella cibaria]
MLDKRLFKFPGARQALGVLSLLTLIQALAIIGQGRFLSVAITDLWGGHQLTSIGVVIVWFMLAYLLRQVMGVAKQYALAPFADKTTASLQTQLTQKYAALGPRTVANQGTGKSVTLAVEGIDQVHDYLTLVLVKLFDMSITPWLILLYIATINFKEAVFLFVIYPVIVIFMIVLGLAAQAKADREYETFNRLSNHFVDSLRGLTTLKQLGLAKQYAQNIYDVSEDHRKATMSTLKIAILSTFALDFFTTLSIAVVALFLGLGLMDGATHLLPALTILVLAPEYFLPIRNFANDYHATLNGKNALADIMTLLEQPVAPETNRYVRQSQRWQATDTLTLEQVSFSYPNADRPALQQINLTLTGHAKVALVGTSGSGKSTLLNLLGGFLVGDGDVKINEQALPHLQQRQWQEQIQVLPQHPYIFHDTLRANLAFYAPDQRDEDLIAVLQQVGLADWFASLPDGLDTLIGEGAMQTSGGQAQRIGLARIMLDEERRVLLLDEPTAHLDIETEALLKETMLPVFDNRLVIFATHRLHWLRQMDWIIVMRDGQIAEQGTLADLIANNGYFVTLQAAMRGTTHA